MDLRPCILISAILLGMSVGVAGQNDHPGIQSFLDSSKHYEALNKNKQAYSFSKKAQDLMLATPGTSLEKIARTESDLGTLAYRMGNIGLAEIHHRKALRLFKSMPKPNYECLYLSGNNMGGIMWHASKTDSAIYYFGIALDAISKMDQTPINKYYRPAVLNNNLAAIYGQQGKTTEGIAAMTTTIRNLRLYLSIKDSTLRREGAEHFQFEATDNLAGIYKELGNYRKAYDLLMHSYQQKQKVLGPDNPDIHKSEILLGQLFLSIKEYTKAEQFLKLGLEGLAGADGDFLFWQADAYTALAQLNDAAERKSEAAQCFEKADHLYEESLMGDYDDIYLEFLRSAALFYAINKDEHTAMDKALKGYRYIVSAQGKETLPAFYQLLNLSEVCFALGHYKQAMEYSEKGLKVVNNQINTGHTLLDSIKMSLKKPKAILIIARSQYAMLQKKTPEALTAILKMLNQALSILETRKSVLREPSDISLLMNDHADLLEFSKQIVLDLYNLTGSQPYVDQLVILHESGMYNRIRSRLDANSGVRFAGLPENIREAEKKLRDSVTSAFDESGDHDKQMHRHLQLQYQWNTLLEQLRRDYPEYYKMRYASIFKPMDEVVHDMPPKTTVIRFIFTGNNLFALVADQDSRKLLRLNEKGLEDEISTITHTGADEIHACDILHKLYERLWEPLAKNIKYKRIIIIPDGILYNVNFEILTPEKIGSFDELASHSILTDYTISYQYSLFLLKQGGDRDALAGNFIAFAPGFSDRSKEEYRTTSDTAVEIDNFYLNLLPQPFSVDLALQTAKQFDGDIFMNENSTVSSFKEHANGHRIIHIGTHAVADNLYPQFSRLVFSKDVAHGQPDNYLYLFDIYNCSLQSDLTVLTACESGKVGYKDGEGMISMAHAFNYAGSKSILMGLWKIDEQASASLINIFYKNLEEGMNKDEALRQAKLSYLSRSHGRTLAPSYWAGLVLMGDTFPVSLSAAGNSRYLIICSMILLLLVAGYVVVRLLSDRNGRLRSHQPIRDKSSAHLPE